ncbi:DUF1127 domain-containing protein [Pseudohalocynthiibacter aestuariivivens]|uniref:DUF1127 domain-containing protein n=1 Tax=Roseovarius pelagicus TaxID=2980108 RepID=A0ABY6D778_9RHOB|nr:MULTISPECIES: DUF1127 domain-containing protein [Rhodobacterales]QIE46033.1 DUF1127 domain-containing protein [Pseudohalocynthiibacter aestuariivivens]UXX82006.1 DUF1127 domain-containing protein [Roseovarius pelagicus]
MIIASNALVRRSGHSRTLIQAWNQMRLMIAKRRAYVNTVKTLSTLTDRELSDLGIIRSQIAAKASDCVYGTRHTA